MKVTKHFEVKSVKHKIHVQIRAEQEAETEAWLV